jgi:hypothetical protein
MSKSIVTPVGRASFPHLDKPNMYGKYALTILLPKNGKGVKEFVKWLGESVKSEAIGIAGEKGLQSAMAEFQAFKDGDNAKAFKTPRAEYAGNWVLSISRKTEFGKPCVVNRFKQPIDPTEIYAGCDVLAYIDVFGYKYGNKKSVSIGVQHIMKVAENTPCASSGVPVENAFDNIDLPEGEEVAVDAVESNPFGGNTTETTHSADNTTADPFAGV